MPLEKRFDGRPVVRTKAQRGKIWVRLKRRAGEAYGCWVCVTPEAYHARMTCRYVPRPSETVGTRPQGNMAQ